MATRTDTRTITEPTTAHIGAVTVLYVDGAASKVRVHYQVQIDGRREERSKGIEASALPVGAQTALATLLTMLARVAAQEEGF